MTGRTTPAATVESNDKTSRYALGLWFILLQCIVWIAAAVLTQHVYEEELGVPPFLMTYFGISLLALSLPLHQFKLSSSGQQDHDEPKQQQFPIVKTPSMDSIDLQYEQAQSCTDYTELAWASGCQLSRDHVRTWNHKRHLRAALFLAPGMFGADYMFNKSLALTSVASCTVLVSTQSIFVFVFAVLLRLESFSMIKLMAVIAGVVGTALTAVDDLVVPQEEHDTTTVMVGDLFAVGAAVLYAVYTTQVRQYCPQNEELYSMPLLLGYIGAVCGVMLAPIGLYMAYEVEQWSWKLVWIILGKGLLDFAITDYCMFRAIVLTNATIATVGLGLTIPMAFATDWAMGKQGVLSPAGIPGALFIGISFLVVNIAPEETRLLPNKAGKDEYDERDECDERDSKQRSNIC